VATSVASRDRTLRSERIFLCSALDVLEVTLKENAESIDERIQWILGENALRVFAKVCG